MTALITAPGVYDLPAEVYHADQGVCPAPSLSQSGAKLILDCPARWLQNRNEPKEPTAALDVGKAAHEWLLEGDAWPQRFVVLPEDHDGRSKTGRALVEGILASDRRPLKHDDFETIKAMREALAKHPMASLAFQGGKAEQSLYWQDAETGVWLRARPDYLPAKGRILTDYKTARSVEPEALRRAIAEYGYHIQAARYTEAAQICVGIERPRFLFVFQEKTPPYLVNCVELDGLALQFGALLDKRARRIFAECLSKNEWPGYSDGVTTLALPDWQLKQLQAQHERGLFDLSQSPLAAE